MTFFKKFRSFIAATFIAVFGGFMYTRGIMGIGFDGDEMFTATMMHFGNWFKIITIGNIADTHPPLYHTLLFIYTKIFGISELSLRFFSVNLGVITIYLVFYLAKKLFSIKEAVISSLFMAIMWNMLVVSQYARGYTLLLMLSVLSTYALVNLIESKDRLIFYAVPAALMMYTHYFGILVIFCHVLFVAAFFNKNLKRVAAAAGLAAVFYAPWVPFIYKKYVYTESFDFGNWFSWHLLSGYSAVIFIILLAFLAGAGLLSLVKSRKNFVENNYQVLFLFWMAFVPFIVIYCTDKFLFKCYSPRYMHMFAVYYYILFARAITLLFRRNILIFAACAALFVSISFKTADSLINRPLADRTDAPSRALKLITSKPNSAAILPYDNHFDYHISLQNVMPAERFKSIGFRKTAEESFAEFENFISQTNPPHIWVLSVSSHEVYPPLEAAKEKYKLMLKENLSNHWALYLFTNDSKS